MPIAPESERRPRLVQKRQLFRRGGAAQHRVAVRVAPKAVDDGLMPALKVQVVFHARLRKQVKRLFMNHGRFAVHVRHVGKHALRRGQAAVLPAGHQLLRQGKGQRVLRKGAGGVAVHIARELVQHQDFCQPAFGCGAPGEQFTAGCGVQRRAEAGEDGFIQGCVFGEVLLGREFGEPEIED